MTPDEWKIHWALQSVKLFLNDLGYKILNGEIQEAFEALERISKEVDEQKVF